MNAKKSLMFLVLVVFLLMIIPSSLQAFEYKENRWFGSFYVDTTLDQEQSNNALCFGDSLFYIAWIGEKASGSNHVYVKRIIPDSVAIDSQPIDVTVGDSNSFDNLDVGYSNNYLFAVYAYIADDYGSDGENIYASVLNTNNDSINDIFIGESYYDELGGGPYNDYQLQALHYPVVVGGIGEFLVMYDYYYESSQGGIFDSVGPYIKGRFISYDGTYKSGFSIPCKNKVNPKSLIFDGEDYVLVFKENDTTLNIVKIDSSGDVINRNSIYLLSPHMRMEVGTNGVAFGKNRYLVVWSDYTDGAHCILGRLYSENLNVIDSSIIISKDQYVKTYPSVVFDSNNFVVTWQQYYWDSYNIRGAVLSKYGVVTDSFLVDSNPGDQIDTKMAYGKGYTLLTYTSWSSHFQKNKIIGRFSQQTVAGITKTAQKEKTEIYCSVKYLNPDEIDLKYSLPINAFVKFRLFDLSGRNIEKINIGYRYKGVYSNTLDCSGLKVGVYFYKLEYGNNVYSGKINIMR